MSDAKANQMKPSKRVEWVVQWFNKTSDKWRDGSAFDFDEQAYSSCDYQQRSWPTLTHRIIQRTITERIVTRKPKMKARGK